MTQRPSGAAPKLSRGADRTAKSGRIADADLAGHEAMLLDAARGLFYAHGFDGTSIDAVARRAHVSPKTIYGRFGGKAGLFLEAMRARADEIMAPLDAPVATEAGVRASLERFARNLLAVTTRSETVAIQRAIVAQALQFPELASSFHATGPARGIARVAQFLERAAAAGVIRVADPALAADLFVGALTGTPMRESLFLGTAPTRAAIGKRARDVVAMTLRAYART